MKSAQQSSARVNNVVQCLTVLQSVIRSHLACTSLFYQVPEYTHYVQLKQTTLGQGQRGRSSRGRGGQRRRSAHPPRWDRSNPWNQCERPKKNEQNQENVPKTFVMNIKCQIDWLLALRGATRRRTPRRTKPIIFTKCSLFYIDL